MTHEREVPPRPGGLIVLGIFLLLVSTAMVGLAVYRIANAGLDPVVWVLLLSEPIVVLGAVFLMGGFRMKKKS